MLFSRPSQFSDARCRGFESLRAHQRQHPFGRCLFLFGYRVCGMLRGGIRTAAKATAACGGSREPKQGPRSQRASPAQGAQPDAGTATRTVPAVLRPGKKPLRGFFRARLGESLQVHPCAAPETGAAFCLPHLPQTGKNKNLSTFCKNTVPILRFWWYNPQKQTIFAHGVEKRMPCVD